MGLLIFVFVIDAKTIQKYKDQKTALIKKKVKVVVHEKVRLRDQINDKGDFICISCQLPKPKNQCNAGHYFNSGFHPSVRYDLDNIHSQCIRCNFRLHGNLIPYRENLIRKIGIKKFEQLEVMAHLKANHSRIMLIHILEKYKPSK